jgi:hypothetical protein
MENIEEYEIIRRKLIHIKSRPTFKNISSMYSILDEYGFKDIEKLGYKNYTYDNILELCRKIEELDNKCRNPKVVKSNNQFVSIKFEESLLLPEHIYRSVKDVDDSDDILDNDKESLTDSIESEIIEEIDEEYYDSGNDEFSE